jgi:putative ABC transport system permease protein
MRSLLRRVRHWLHRGQLERDLAEEMETHRSLRQARLEEAGMPAGEAELASRRALGNTTLAREDAREIWVWPQVGELVGDLRYAVRLLRRSPGFTAVAILSLALGIGANTTIFTFVNAVLLRPLPYPGSDRMVVLREQPLASDGTVSVHPVNFVEWHARARAFEALALVQTPPLNVIGSSGAEQITRVQTTSELFRVFGLAPALGRAFTEEETRPGRHDVVILGHGFWQRWFGGDPGVVGRRLAVQDGSLTIVGVAPAGLRIGVMEPDAYTPLPIDPANPWAIGSRSFDCYGRLKPGISLGAARAEMAVVAAALARQYPMDTGMGVFVSGLHEYLVREGRPALRLLMAVVSVVLVIACVNLAALLMARGIGRRGELALRALLGASRGRLLRQLVIESLVLAMFGGAAGLILAYWATQALAVLTAGALTVGSHEPIRLDATCLVFTLVVSTLTALVFGLMPAWQASHVQPQAALREQGRGGTADRRHHRMRSLLVVTEVALAVVLLAGAGLLLRTFSSLVRVNLGFQPAGTISMGLFLGLRSPEARAALVDQILDRVEALPGVKVASTIQFLPLTGATCGTGFWLEGQPQTHPSRALPTECSLVSRGYFATMGIPVVEGRPFDRRDRAGSPRVLVVNESFARRYFPDGRVLGRRIQVHSSNQALADIVGVVGDIRHNGLTTEPAPTVFLLHAQTPGYITNLVVRTTGEAAAQAAAVRRAIQDVDPTQAVSAFKPLDQYVADALARPRMYAALVACFAAVAVTLAAIGVYGLIAYVVTQRTHEIGIRLALGAARRRVFLDLFGQGARLVVSGLVVGVAAAVALRGVVSTLLFGVTPGDPVSYALAAAAFAVVATAAVGIPARRAARVDPIRALRCE